MRKSASHDHHDHELHGGFARLLLALAMACALPASAQVNTGVIRLDVTDSEGGVLPGVSVTVINLDTGLTRNGATDGSGSLALHAVPPGTYSVSAAAAGFATITEDELELRLGQTARLRVEMQVGFSETITVTAPTGQVDVYRTDTSTNITPVQIQELPVPDRDFQKLAFIAPGVQRERGGYRFIYTSPLIGSSGNASETTIMVDGVDFTDQALGLSRARFSQDAISEFRVINNRFDTEIGNSSGGALSVITRSGTNQVHGSAFVFWRDDALRAQGALEEGSQNFSRSQLGFTIGGPITRDETHYFASLESIDERDFTPFRPGGAFVDQAEDIELPVEQLLAFASFDHRLTGQQTLQLKLMAERYRMDNFRVGGASDESNGMELNRDNWNLIAGHTWVVSDTNLNDLHLQVGQKHFEEPNNSSRLCEWFSFGGTLRTGANIIGDQEMDGSYIELRDTVHMAPGTAHDLKLGGSISFIEEDWYYPLLPWDWMIYLTDDRSLPARYDHFTGEPGLAVDTKIFALFVQDDWRPRPDLTLSLGLRWDYDSDGSNPDFESSGHELVGERSPDDDNWQPRLGFSWDAGGKGATVFHGGVGVFTGRYLMVPAFIEQQQNGLTGAWLTRVSGLLYGLPVEYWLDADDPRNTGIPLPPNITLMEDNLKAPESLQASLGVTQRLGDSGLSLNADVLYSKGDNEIVIRDTNWAGNELGTRPNPTYAQINMYTNDGESEYKALILGVNGVLDGGHVIACNVTYADKMNIADDFSPNVYPSDPAHIEQEWGRARSDEGWRVVLSAVFRLPYSFTVAPIFQYGSGQPWNRRLGYDYNLDGQAGDRAPGVARNSEDGPVFRALNLRITWTVRVGGSELDVIAEGFNVFDTTNYSVGSVDSAEYLGGPTLANPTLPWVENPSFGTYGNTLSPREIQIGLRYRF